MEIVSKNFEAPSFKKHLKNIRNMILPMATLMLIAGSATASSVGTEFDSMYTMVSNWLEGWQGEFLAIASVITLWGIVKQSITLMVLGIGSALICSYLPTIVDTLFRYAV